MNEADFDACIAAAYDALPERFREACAGLSVLSQPLPDQETLKALGLSEPYELLGLYHGVNLTQKSVFDLPARPDTVLIYRLPILAYAQARDLPVEQVVRHVLIHEIGHHFGFSDDDMERIEDRYRPD